MITGSSSGQNIPHPILLLLLLESPLCRCWLRFIVQHRRALGNVSRGCTLIEPSLAMGTLNVIQILRRRWRWQVREFATPGQMGLHFFSRTNRRNKLLVLLPPVALLRVRLHNDPGDCFCLRCSHGTSRHRSTLFADHVTLSVRSLE